jgi:hypothetical protein
MDADRKSAAMIIIESGNHTSLLVQMNSRNALYHTKDWSTHPDALRRTTLQHLSRYAAERRNLDAITVLIDLTDHMVEHVAQHVAFGGRLEVLEWLVENFGQTVVSE